jgi:hypothetical protein
MADLVGVPDVATVFFIAASLLQPQVVSDQLSGATGSDGRHFAVVWSVKLPSRAVHDFAARADGRWTAVSSDHTGPSGQREDFRSFFALDRNRFSCWADPDLVLDEKTVPAGVFALYFLVSGAIWLAGAARRASRALIVGGCDVFAIPAA